MTSLEKLLSDALRDDDVGPSSVDADVDRAMADFRRRRTRRLALVGTALGTAALVAGVGAVSLIDDRATNVLVPATPPPVIDEPSDSSHSPATTVTNRFPVATADSVSIVAGQSIVLDVLANDLDEDGDRLSVVTVTAGRLDGEVALGISNLPQYAAPSFATTDVFEYRVEDPKGGFDVGTVTVEVVVAPEGDDGS